MNLWYRSNGELSRQRLKIKRMILTFLDLALLTDSRVSGFFLSQEFFPRNLDSRDYLVKLRFFFTGFSQNPRNPKNFFFGWVWKLNETLSFVEFDLFESDKNLIINFGKMIAFVFFCRFRPIGARGRYGTGTRFRTYAVPDFCSAQSRLPDFSAFSPGPGSGNCKFWIQVSVPVPDFIMSPVHGPRFRLL